MHLDVTDSNFEEEVIKKSGEIPVVVDFWAPWCAPCNILKPVLEKLADEFDGRFILAKMDVNEHKEKAGEYGVMGIPAVKMFQKGEVVAEFTGAMSEDQARQWLNENLQ